MFTTMNPDKYNTKVSKFFKVTLFFLDGRTSTYFDDNDDEYAYYESLGAFLSNVENMGKWGVFLMEMRDDDELLLHSSDLTGFLDDVFRED